MRRVIILGLLLLAGCIVIYEETGSMVECDDPRPESCTERYEPVCALVEVECVTAPCPPVEETFPSACAACANERVRGYVDGQCR